MAYYCYINQGYILFYLTALCLKILSNLINLKANIISLYFTMI